MEYTIGELAAHLNMPASTLRYYEKQGLLKDIKRTEGGIRVFSERDHETLKVIECLKKSGLSIQEIRDFMHMTTEGNKTIDARLALFQQQYEQVKQNIQQLKEVQATLEYKCWFYETAKKAGTTEYPEQMPLEDIPKRYQKAKTKLLHD